MKLSAMWAGGHGVTHLGEIDGDDSFCKAKARFPDVLLWDSDDHETDLQRLRLHGSRDSSRTFPLARECYCTRCAAIAMRQA